MPVDVNRSLHKCLYVESCWSWAQTSYMITQFNSKVGRAMDARQLRIDKIIRIAGGHTENDLSGGTLQSVHRNATNK